MHIYAHSNTHTHTHTHTHTKYMQMRVGVDIRNLKFVNLIAQLLRNNDNYFNRQGVNLPRNICYEVIRVKGRDHFITFISILGVVEPSCLSLDNGRLIGGLRAFCY